MTTATVYVGPNCPACKVVVSWLEKQGVKVEQRSYTDAPFDIYSVPVTVIGDEMLTGFNKPQLVKALRKAREVGQ